MVSNLTLDLFRSLSIRRVFDSYHLVTPTNVRRCILIRLTQTYIFFMYFDFIFSQSGISGF